MDANLFHELEGKNIYFKALDTADAERVHEYASDEDVSRFIGWRLMVQVDETRDYIAEILRREAAGTHLYASVVLKATREIIGTAMIFNFEIKAKHAEIGYVFHKDYWGMGYCTETVALMDRFASETLKLHKLDASVVDTNTGSVRVLEKNGFELEGRLKDHFFIEGRYYDGLLFGKILPQ